MRWMIFSLLVASLVALGCTDDDTESGAGGAGGGAGAGGTALEWPPDATVYLGQYGIFHADCATDDDCAMALGYYHARDRFLQMDLQRRFATGAITAVVNKTLVEAAGSLDGLVNLAASNRALYSTRDGTPAEEAILTTTSPKTLGLLEAYATGVNQWLEDVRSGSNDAKWPREFQSAFLDYGPEDAPDWTPRDSLAAVIFLVELLTNDEGSHYSAAAAQQEINDPLRFSDLWSREPINKSSILTPEEYQASQTIAAAPMRTARPPLDLVRRAGPAFKRLQNQLTGAKALKQLLFGSDLERDAIGSNNWVLGPSMTANGGTLLSNDPHLTLSQPPIWYIAHLDAKTNGTGEIHTAGVTLSGLPFVIIGRNENIAWGATNTGVDFSDVYVEELVKDGDGEPLGAMLNGEVVEFIKVDKTFVFNDGSTSEPQTLLFHPEHGPVRSVDLENNIALTLRWTGQDLNTDLDFFTDAARATNVEQFRTAAENVTTIGQCWVSIDREGNFGWFPYNQIPKRTWASETPSWLPIEGTGAFEWDAYFELSEIPQTFNRAIGYVATANNDFIGALADGDPTNDGQPPFQVDASDGFRHARIVDLIERSNAHTVASMLEIVGDTHLLYGETMTPKLLEIVDDPMMPELSVNAQKVVNALRPWNYDCPTGLQGNDPVMSALADVAEVEESAGCAAFHVTLQELDDALANDENKSGLFVTYFSVVDPSRLAAGDDYWDDVRTPAVETKFATMATALEAAGEILVGRLGTDETQWAWGRMHGVILRSDLSALSSFFNEFNNPSGTENFYATVGGISTVNVASPGRSGLHGSGPSTRFVCEGLADNLSCTIQLPGGQSSDIESLNYDNLLPLWLENQPIDLVFDIGQAATEAAATCTPNSSGFNCQ